MSFNAEDIKRQIPYYLAESDQKALVSELNAFNSGQQPDFFLSSYNDNFENVLLQGDCWTGFELLLFSSGVRKTVRGVVLSNSCDISSENPRDIPTRIVFSPLVKLSKYRELLDRSGLNQEKVNSKIESIKQQKTSNLFYLPAGGPLDEDSLVRLDDLYSMPSAAHRSCEKIFTLSRTGFYLFVLKLSVHFCRLQENVERK